LFSGVDTDIMKFMFHSETNLANTDYRENRSMILSGLSLWEKGSPLHKSTQQVENLRPDTACGLQAEKTGRFSLHRRDNTRPDKTRQRRIRQMCRPIVGCGATYTPHISLPNLRPISHYPLTDL
ncbi:hypothetical protein MZT89_16580, partial [Escherichia coli]